MVPKHRQSHHFCLAHRLPKNDRAAACGGGVMPHKKRRRRLRMTKWLFRLVPLTVLLTTTADAAPMWVRNGDETGVRERVTDVDREVFRVVIEYRDRVKISSSSTIAIADVWSREVIKASYTYRSC